MLSRLKRLHIQYLRLQDFKPLIDSWGLSLTLAAFSQLLYHCCLSHSCS